MRVLLYCCMAKLVGTVQAAAHSIAARSLQAHEEKAGMSAQQMWSITGARSRAPREEACSIHVA